MTMTRAEHFASVAAKIERERIPAREAVHRLLKSTPEARWSQLAEHPELQTCGALEHLGNVFTDEYSRNPKRALAIAELAVSLAEGIRSSAYPPVILAQLKGIAWKDLGKVLSALNRNVESADALLRAESIVAERVALRLDLAVIRYNLAITYQELERFTESLQLLIECKEVFRQHGNTRFHVFCGFAEGVLLQRLRRYREARETYLLLFASTPNIEKESRAALHHAIGFCSIELGDFDDAEANLTQAINLHRELGHSIEALKAEAGLGRLYIRKGDADLAIHHLTPIRRAFLGASLPEEAGLCALEIIEGMLLQGNASQAESLARLVVREFAAAGLNARAITALGYLSEAIRTQNATVKLVTHVREYILSLRQGPEREFAPY